MLKKATSWYVRTAWLKTQATFFSVGENLGLLKSWEDRNRHSNEELFRRFGDKDELTPGKGQPGEFIAYAFHDDPGVVLAQLGTGMADPLFRIDRQKAGAFNPLVPAYTGLVIFNSYLTDPQAWKLEKMNATSRFLTDYGLERGNALFFPYYVDLPKFHLKAPWVSGIAQAHILSFFLRMHALQGNPELLDRAGKIVASFFVPAEEGGVFILTGEGYPWIAEYPAPPVPYVLNGFLFALIALHEYLLVVPDGIPREKLKGFSESFFLTFHKYQRGKNLKYCRTRKDLSNIQYQGLFIFQLLHLYALTGNEAWKILALKWEANVDWRSFCRFHGISDPGRISEKIRSLI